MKSILFVPATRADLVEKAARGQASVVCLDLEDGVAADRKAAARAALPELCQTLKAAGKPVALRINAEVAEISYDLAATPDALDYIVLPMASTRHQIAQLATWADRRFGDGCGPQLIAMIETPAGPRALEQGTSPLPDRLSHVAFGTEDFAAATGTAPDGPLVQAAFADLAAFAAEWSLGLLGYPGSIANIRDPETFQIAAKRGQTFGAVGGFAIHPAQVEVLNAVFALSDEDASRARHIITHFEAALAAGKGAVQLDGQMIDRPVYLAAKRLLSLA